MRPSKEEQILYNVEYSKDTEFAAYARLLQSKWRVKKGYSAGKLGNYLETEFALSTKANFVTERIGSLVEKEIAATKETGALIGQPRIWENLLSSQPLCFNLFGELHYDLEMATQYFRSLFPFTIDRVISIKFEYSPGRGDISYLHDHSAFDVFVEYESRGELCFLGIEVKYAESLKEETVVKADKQFKERYAILTESSGMFKEGVLTDLKRPPYSQIWRDHLLAISILQHSNKKYHKGQFVFLCPAGNNNCVTVANEYRKFSSNSGTFNDTYNVMHLEEYIDKLILVSGADWAKEIKNRYLGV